MKPHLNHLLPKKDISKKHFINQSRPFSSIIIITITCFLIIYFYSLIRTKNEIIHNYKQKELIASLNISINSLLTDITNLEHQMKLLYFDQETVNKTKSEKEIQLSNIIAKLSNLKRYKLIFDKLINSSPVLLTYMEKVEGFTNCTFRSNCYRMSRDGFTSKAFHEKCDGLKPTITLIYDESYNVIGGLTYESWEGKEMKYDKKALVFSFWGRPLPVKDNMPAITTSPDLFPSFGEDDLVLSEKETSIRKKLNSYESSHKEGKEKVQLKLTELEVYQVECKDAI